MSKRREIERQVHGLSDIGEIMNAMKNLSLMESHRLLRFMETQRRVVSGIESAVNDFLYFWPQGFLNDKDFYDLYLLVGAERGFCGDFNESLVRAFDREFGSAPDGTVIVVGAKLASKLAGDRRIRASLDGASVVEEVEQVLVNVTDTLSAVKSSHATTRALRMTVLHHASATEGVTVSVLPPFNQKHSADKARFAYPPVLNLNPHLFLSGLIEMYLLAALQELLYGSLLAENQRRMQHMDSAARRLEQTAADLLLKRNVLRQEEITEEIEIIMLSVGALGRR